MLSKTFVDDPQTDLSHLPSLLLLVEGSTIHEHMKEALVCYQAGAYKASIVMAANAVFEYLRLKTHELGTTNETAAQIAGVINDLLTEQKAFERTLVDRLLKAQILDLGKIRSLNGIIEMRNKAAHPSGNRLDADAANYVFSTAVKEFLSRPHLLARTGMTDLRNRLSHSGFFIDTDDHSLGAMVSLELETLDDGSAQLFMKELSECYGEAEPILRDNTRLFLRGYLTVAGEKRQVGLAKMLFRLASDVEAYAELLHEIFVLAPHTHRFLDDGTRRRLDAALAHSCRKLKNRVSPRDQKHPLELFDLLMSAFEESTIESDFKLTVAEIVELYCDEAPLISGLKKGGEIKQKILGAIKDVAFGRDKARLWRFTTMIIAEEYLIATELSGHEALELLCVIHQLPPPIAEDGRAALLREDGTSANVFEALTFLKEAAATVVKMQDQEAIRMLSRWGVDPKLFAA
ncbi:hypothetical protein HFN01_19345 [Rhizobium leguminosarum]|uniref:hypothetical protein n=1 Tax=Rhizobium leguminosarum TaxID=384 RepID=UPI001C94C5CA|nr:hypothetical protein [Rhizobium leguminosarum]MBY5396967.1 hypothetical protein [Rhizobium leguminosarum]